MDAHELELLMMEHGIFTQSTISGAVAKGEDFTMWTVPWMLKLTPDGKVGIRDIEVDERETPGGTVQMKVTFASGKLTASMTKATAADYLPRVISDSSVVMATNDTVLVDSVVIMDGATLRG